MTVIKFLLILSAAGVAVLRFIGFRYETALSPDTLHLMTVISIVCAAVCLICAGIWIIQVKREEKKAKQNEPDKEQKE